MGEAGCREKRSLNCGVGSFFSLRPFLHSEGIRSGDLLGLLGGYVLLSGVHCVLDRLFEWY